MGLPDPTGHNNFHWPTELCNIFLYHYIHYNVFEIGQPMKITIINMFNIIVCKLALCVLYGISQMVPTAYGLLNWLGYKDFTIFKPIRERFYLLVLLVVVRQHLIGPLTQCPPL